MQLRTRRGPVLEYFNTVSLSTVGTVPYRYSTSFLVRPVLQMRCVVRGGGEVWRHVQRRITARRWWSGDGDCLAEDWRGDNGVSQHRTTSGDNGDGSDSNDMQAGEALRAGAEDR
jgi:hypothetical protein